MARDVHNILLTIIKENGSMSENEAADYVKKLSAKGRYAVDVWSWIVDNQPFLLQHGMYDYFFNTEG